MSSSLIIRNLVSLPMGGSRALWTSMLYGPGLRNGAMGLSLGSRPVLIRSMWSWLDRRKPRIHRNY